MAGVTLPNRDLVYTVTVVANPFGGRRLVVKRFEKLVYVQPVPRNADLEEVRLTLFNRWRARARSQGGDAHIRTKGIWVVTLPERGDEHVD